jgi:hypothetical protein
MWIWSVIGMTLTGEEGSTYRGMVQFVHHNSTSSFHVRNECFATKTTGRNVEIRHVSSTVYCNSLLYFLWEIKLCLSAKVERHNEGVLGVEVQRRWFLISTLDVSSYLDTSGRFTRAEVSPFYHWVWGSVRYRCCGEESSLLLWAHVVACVA